MIQTILYRLSQRRIRKLREFIASTRDADGKLTYSGQRATEKLDRLLRDSRRYWSLATHGGGVVALGLLTRDEARDKVLALGYEITAVNVNGAFVAVREQRRERPADNAA